ncbi:hypothetical protein [Massilia sp. PWRC2]|uniref:hypothetical protein n=1 Tax=Massilia sp. PWRC2 TaxID=2804626 RepID=UPI003CE7887E
MSRMPFHSARVGAALLLGAVVISSNAADAPVRIRGQIAAVDAASITVTSREGETVKLALAADQAISAVKNLQLADIKKDSYIGTATKTGPNGTLQAVEVLVFPETARGTGEGHYAWDLLPGSMMTNANVEASLDSVNGRTLKLAYKGGVKEVTVPAGTPVVTMAAASRADLIVGKKVFVIATDGASGMKAGRIVVEKDGVVPPM